MYVYPEETLALSLVVCLYVYVYCVICMDILQIYECNLENILNELYKLLNDEDGIVNQQCGKKDQNKKVQSNKDEQLDYFQYGIVICSFSWMNTTLFGMRHIVVDIWIDCFLYLFVWVNSDHLCISYLHI